MKLKVSLSILTGVLLVACVPGNSGNREVASLEPGTAQEMTLAEGDRVYQCGGVVGMAVRCGYVASEYDFARLRSAMEAQFDRRYGASPARDAAAHTFDRGVVDRMGEVRSCEIPRSQISVVEASIRSSVASCLGT